MIKIPIYNKGRLPNDLGSEFNKMQNQERNRGLIDPPIRSAPVNRNNLLTEVDFDGLNNEQIILENNSDPSEEEIKSNMEAMQFISRVKDSNRKLTPEEKFYMTNYAEFDLDPRLVKALENEDIKDPTTNITAQESQDFVGQVQTSIQSYEKERFLYQGQPKRFLDKKGKLKPLTAEELFETIVSSKSIPEAVGKTVKKLQEDTKRAEQEEKKRTETIVKPAEKPMREKIIPKPELSFGEKLGRGIGKVTAPVRDLASNVIGEILP